MKKRYLAIPVISLMILLTACGGNHVHSPSGGWICDPEQHWQVCECGEPINTAAHTLHEGFCTDCGCEIAFYEDGSKTVQEYDAVLDLVKETVYDAGGNAVHES